MSEGRNLTKMRAKHSKRKNQIPIPMELAHAMGPDWQIVLDSLRPVGSPMAAMLDRGKTAITLEPVESK